MKKTLYLLTVLALAATPFVMQRTTRTLVFTAKGHLIEGTSETAGGRRLYMMHDTTALFMLDRTTGREVQVMAGFFRDFDVSPAGDRITFTRKGEDGKGPFVWTLALDPATGLASGTPRRVSMMAARFPTFAPDGKSIAFADYSSDSAQLVIIPATGGPERVIVRLRSDFFPIQFTRDGRFIYYGASFWDAPVTTRNGTYRVPTTGGRPQLIVNAGDYSAFPGLSPDERSVMVWNATYDSIIVASVDGRRITAYQPPEGYHEPASWTSNGKVRTYHNVTPRVVSIRSLVNNSSRTLTDSNLPTLGSVWSPDGSRVAILGESPFDIIIANVDGSSRRVLRTKYPVYPNRGVYWSPDGRSIAYRARGATRHKLGVIDVATGNERSDFAPASGAVAPRWRSDSRAIIYTTSDTILSRDSTLSVTIHEKTLDGQDRVLRTERLHCSAPRVARGLCAATFRDDSTLVAWGRLFGRTIRAFNFRSTDTARVWYTVPSNGMLYAPDFSRNNRWMAIRLQVADGQRGLIDVMASGASEKKTVTLPFALSRDADMWISPDGRTLIVGSGSAPDELVTFYRVDVESGRQTKLTVVPRTNRVLFDHVISPDGNLLAYGTLGTPFATVYETDVSSLLRGSAPQRQ